MTYYSRMNDEGEMTYATEIQSQEENKDQEQARDRAVSVM